MAAHVASHSMEARVHPRALTTLRVTGTGSSLRRNQWPQLTADSLLVPYLTDLMQMGIVALHKNLVMTSISLNGKEEMHICISYARN